MLATMNQIVKLLSGFQKQFPSTNNQLRTSTNPMTQATIQASQITTESVQRRAPCNKGKHAATGSQRKVVTCYNCRGQGHVAKECKEKKRAKDSQCFKDKALLMEAKEKGAIFDTEAEAFLEDVEYTSPYVSQEIHGGEQLDSDVDSIIKDHDNTILYHQYQLNNKVESVPTNVSSVVPGRISVITILDDLSGAAVPKKPKVLAPGLYAMMPKYVPPQKRNNREASTPLPRKKIVSLAKKTNLCVNLSTGIKFVTEASKSKPKYETKTHKNLPTRSENVKRVDYPLRNLNKRNRVDSSLSVKCTGFISKSVSVCKTCNECLVFGNHDKCDVKILNSVNAKNPKVKNDANVKQSWKATSKIFASVGAKWKPIGRKVTLGDACPLTRSTIPKVVLLEKSRSVSTSEPANNVIVTPRKSYLKELAIQGLKASRKLKPGALSLYVGNGQREAVEAIVVFYLCLPSGLEIVLNNCHYTPSITRGVIFVSHLYKHGFINRFMNNTIQVSRNNMVYFSAIPRDGIFKIDLSNSYANDSSMYVVSNKRAKLDLDSALLWHCCLGHISKKRIEKLQHDGLLNSTDLRAFEKCISCMSGKIEKKPYTHQVQRAKDLLGLIHTDVCGTLKSCQDKEQATSSSSLTTLVKVENQLGKTIKLLRSDRRGKYMSQELLDHLKDHGIIAHRTPPYTPQHNGVSEWRNRNLLDMVRSMMSQTTLQKSFWDYTLETAARILNMVPTKKVEKTPSTRTRRSTDHMCLYIDAKEHELGDLGEPANYKAALELPPNGKTVGRKWLFKKKTDMDGALHTYKACLIAKGYTQTPGIDYDFGVNAAKEFKEKHAKCLMLLVKDLVLSSQVDAVDYKKNELKARGTLLMALPDKHQLKFSSHKDAKTLMKPIEKRFGGNTKTKKVQKTLLKQQYENFIGSTTESLDQIHDRLRKLISQLEIHEVSLSQEDVNLNTTEPVSAAASVSAVSTKIPVSPLPNVDSLSNVVIYSFFPVNILRTRRNLRANGLTSLGFDMSKVECYNCHRKGHFARECRSPKDTRRSGDAEPHKRNVPRRSLPIMLLWPFHLQVLLLMMSQRNVKTGLGYNSQVFTRAMFDCDDHLSSGSDERKFMPPKPDLVFNNAPNAVETDHPAFTVKLSPTKPDQDLSYTIRPSAPIMEDWVSDSEDESETNRPYNVPSFVKSTEQVKSYRHSVQHAETSIPPKKAIPKPISNGKCKNRKACFVPVSTVVPKISVTRPRHAKLIVTKPNSPPKRHINCSPSLKASNSPPRVTAVKASLVSAAQGNPKGGKISIKGKIRTGKLDFDDVYFVKKLKFNLFSVSQMCDKKNSVLFIDTECLVLSPEFKLPDENQVLLRVPRENNMYNVNLKNIVPFEDLTCLFAKVTIDESNLWHRRLGHINFKTMNNLVKCNFVRGLPTKVFENDNTCVACKKGKQHRASCDQSNPSAGFQNKFDAEKAGEQSDQQYVLFPVWSSGSTNPHNTNRDAAFDEKEPEFDEKKPESEVNVSPSSSDLSKEQDDKTKREAKGKSPVKSFTRYRDLIAKFQDLSDNSINEVNAAGTLVPTVGQISPNSTNTFSATGNTFSVAGNTFSAAGPSNGATSPTHGKSSCIDASQLPDDPKMPKLEDITCNTLNFKRHLAKGSIGVTS
nr:retrotransposon protein, putative, Ty1-copia subclass [Tanacetum cinerariifolium]